MTRLTVELPDFTEPGGRTDRIRFPGYDCCLIDATALRIITGDAIITRMQINGDQTAASCRLWRRWAIRQVMSTRP